MLVNKTDESIVGYKTELSEVEVKLTVGAALVSKGMPPVEKVRKTREAESIVAVAAVVPLNEPETV